MGGEVQVGHDAEKITNMNKRPERQITVRFASDTAAGMLWNFKPQQAQLKVCISLKLYLNFLSI